MPTDKQLAANRQNAAHSTGPKSAEGKSRSSQNALKHGLRAADCVLPHEDADAFDARLAQWHDAYDVDDPAQLALLEVAAHASWKLKRSARAENARLAKAARDAASSLNFDADARAAALGMRLTCRPLSPRPGDGNPTGARLDRRRRDDPAALLPELKSTLAGVDWLLDAWSHVKAILRRDRALDYTALKTAVRLMGRRPEDLFRDFVVREFFLACFALMPPHVDLHHAAANAAQDLHAHPADVRNLADHHLAPHAYDHPAAALIVARSMIAAELRVLRDLRAHHRAQAAFDAPSIADRTSFDDALSPLIRRYESSLENTLRRAIADLTKLRDKSPKPKPEPEAVVETPTPDPTPARPKSSRRSLPNEPNPSPASDPRRPLGDPNPTPEVARTPHPDR